MSGPYRRFDPSELRVPGEVDPSLDESAEALSVARELEALAVNDGIRPTDGFESRVMAAIADEPAPRVVVRSRSKVRGGRFGVLVLAVRDAWGVATTGGRPFAVRAQALALVLLVVLAVGSMAAVGAVTVGGMLDRASGPNPTVEPAPTSLPPSASPTASPPTTIPIETPEPSEPATPFQTAAPTETAEPATAGGATAKPTATARSTRTPDPPDPPKTHETPWPTKTPEPTDEHRGGGGGDGGRGGHSVPGFK